MWWLVVVTLLVGCAKGKSPSKCRAEAEALERFMKSVDRVRAPFLVSASMTLPVRDDLPAHDFPYADAIELFRDHWNFDDERYDSIEALTAKLAQRHAWAVELGAKRQDPRIIYLAIDRAVTWNHVVATFEAAHDAGFTKQLLVFAGSKRQTPPPPSKLDGELDAAFADPSTRGEKLSIIFGRFADQCPTMKHPFHYHGEDDPRDRTTMLIEDTTTDLIACACKVDMPSLRAAMWRMIAAPMPLAVVEIEATRPGPPSAPRVVLAPNLTSWDDVSKRIDANVTQVWFAAEP